MVDGATASKQPLSVVVSDRNVSQRQLDEIGIRDNSGALLCLCYQGLRHSTPDHLVPFPAQQALLFGDDHHLTELTRPANAGAFSYFRTGRRRSTLHPVLLHCYSVAHITTFIRGGSNPAVTIARSLER